MLNLIIGATALASIAVVMAALIAAAWIVWNLDGPW
jgi:hypothetical protein